MKRLVALAFFAVVAVLPACRQTTFDPGLVVGTGTIHQANVDCSAWFVLADSGRGYQLTSLPAQFQHEQLRVSFALKKRSNMVSICMAGEIADVVSIRKL